MTDLDFIIIDEPSPMSRMDKQLNEQMIRARSKRRRQIVQREMRLNYMLSPVFVDIRSYYTYQNIHKYHEEKHLKSGKFDRKVFH